MRDSRRCLRRRFFFGPFLICGLLVFGGSATVCLGESTPDSTDCTTPGSNPEMTDLWVLTYIRSRVSSTGTDTQEPKTPDNVQTLVTALNNIYGPCTVQPAGVGRLLLSGSRRKVLEVKRFLALIDSPWPQVQMNMWAIQVSGSPKDVAERVERISTRTRMVRDQMQEVQRKLAQLLLNDRQTNDAHCTHWKTLELQFEQAGVDFPFNGPLSLNESLILLTLHPSRQEKVTELQSFVNEQWPRWTSRWKEVDLDPESSTRKGSSPGQPQHIPPKPTFGGLCRLFSDTSQAADQNAFTRFGSSLRDFKQDDGAMARPDAPQRLARTGAVVDRVLKAVMDAFAADMTDLFLDPLLRELQDSVSHRKDKGTALVGRTRIVVTSGLEAELSPEMASFVESSIPRPFGKELLDMAFPASETGTSTAATQTGAAKVLAGLSSGQALALAAILSGDVEPAYTKVAPGIAINIRPSVLPDGGAARLTIDARFGIESEPQNTTNRTDIWRMAPPAGIKSHNVRTDAAVSAFDLFDLSSFSVTASHPQTPLYIPILGRLPIIGKAFQFPRHNKEVLFESLVLVNTVILPRSIELHRFYGKNVDAGQTADEDVEQCREVGTR